MCRPAQCPDCKRPTYAGCGQHVEQVLADVPAAERCQCTGDGRTARSPRAKRSWFKGRTPVTER